MIIIIIKKTMAQAFSCDDTPKGQESKRFLMKGSKKFLLKESKSSF